LWWTEEIHSYPTTISHILPRFNILFTDPAYDYFVAVVIGFGIAMFMSSTDELSFSTDAFGNTEVAGAKWTGLMLLGFFLFFDSFTSQFQSRMFQRHAHLSMVELMFATSAYSTVLSAITLVHTHELSAALEFVYQHSEIHLHFFMFSVCSTIGQLFIYYTIKVCAPFNCRIVYRIS
jgi:adenosine 3'-phospho 5'-phosphosulfate transporter B2